jgi:2-polyprenyl-3-methyl-5-hydroxy-6-metoxy-1,4-benzoquinol methylase
LELGCGNCSVCHVIAEHGYGVVGVDTSESGIAISRQSFPDCQLIQADIYDLPDIDMLHSFDVVLAIEVIEHFLDPKELAKNAKKCLTPGVRLIIYTFYHGYLKNLALSLSGKIINILPYLGITATLKFSVERLTKLLTSEGGTDIKFKCTGRCPYLWQ